MELQEQLGTAVSERDTAVSGMTELAERHAALMAGGKEALAALDHAIDRRLIRAGSPMDKAFDKLREALKL